MHGDRLRNEQLQAQLASVQSQLEAYKGSLESCNTTTAALRAEASAEHSRSIPCKKLINVHS
jgi:cell division septum initiation protein DivIVA